MNNQGNATKAGCQTVGRHGTDVNDPRGNRPKENLDMLLAKRGHGSRKELSDALGIDRRTLARWISGDQFMPNDKLIEAACFLGVGIPFMLDLTFERGARRTIDTSADVRQMSGFAITRDEIRKAIKDISNPRLVVREADIWTGGDDSLDMTEGYAFLRFPMRYVRTTSKERGDGIEYVRRASSPKLEWAGMTVDDFFDCLPEQFALLDDDDARVHEAIPSAVGCYERLITDVQEEIDEYAKSLRRDLDTLRGDYRALPPIISAASDFFLERANSTALEAAVETAAGSALGLLSL